ncbi:hypothetical protein [Hallella colorans]|jgi:hypothetical protein|uniref:Uncharacterized protein n=1 Tax=Hallella colorans TaxID=1703337 RepID=A0A2U0U371_9BACT|nr:hypothetical protein [Hallella colorans]PVX51145.1 hypothetical protein C7379_11651 [Hallella colorans]
MLQRDYFIRLIEEFQAALARLLHVRQDDKRDDMIRDLYRQYVGNYDDLRNLTVDEMMIYGKEQWCEDQRVERLNFLAELLYAEAEYKANPLRGMLMDKAFKLFSYVDSHSGVMSLDRRQKMKRISREIGSAKA